MVDLNVLKLFCLLLFPFLFIEAQPQLHTFTINDQVRQYYLYVPDSLNAGVPLVFVLHGYTGSAVSIMNYTDMNYIADEKGFVVCYPQGLIDEWGNSFWNVGYAFHQNETVDDVAFLTALAQYLQMQYTLSSYNTFSAGMSNGGEMSYMLACQSNNVFKGIASVAGIMFESFYNTCDPCPTNIFEIHGTQDDINWWNGDSNNEGGWGPYIGVEEGIDFWVGINNCTQTIIDTLPNIDLSDDSIVITEKHIEGVNSKEVWLYKIMNGGHDWPGVWGNMDINAGVEILDFFSQFLVVADVGDINFDESIDLTDILLISDNILDFGNYNYLSDFNQDHAVNMQDIIFLAFHILGF
jgi:polyhydroxybutyrate depolymerase